jgi:hypothetical protein
MSVVSVGQNVATTIGGVRLTSRIPLSDYMPKSGVRGAHWLAHWYVFRARAFGIGQIFGNT